MAEPDEGVVVVGSGMSGCAVAAELLRHRVPVTVFEAGPRRGRHHVSRRAATAPQVDPGRDPHFVPFDAHATGPHYGPAAGTRRRVGGRSLYWRGICLPVEPYALADWPPALRRALDRPGGLYDEVTDHLVRWAGRHPDACRHDHEAALVEQVRRQGYPGARATPRALRPLDGGGWDVYSPLIDVPRRVVRPDRTVTGVIPHGADHVEVLVRSHGRVGSVRARAVVLSAGTVESGRLVHGATAGAGGPPLDALPIADHHVQGWVSLSPAPPGPPGPESSVLVQSDLDGRHNLFLECGEADGWRLLDAWTMGEQLLSPASTVRFEPGGRARFDVRFTDRDREVLAAQEGALDRLADTLGIPRDPRSPVPETVPDFDAAVARARSLPRRAIPYYCPLGHLDHESGGLALGGPTVDDTGKLRGLGPIYVAGPSLFPRPGAANPGLTILALARRIARTIAT